MKGDIEMKVTHETVVQAVQMLFDQQFAAGKAPTVDSVEQEGGTSSYGGRKGFVIKAKEAVSG